MTALQLLMQQHDRIESLLEGLVAPVTNREEALQELATLLRLHMRLEEELFYPAIEERGTKALVAANYGEHRLAQERLEALELSSSDVPFDERVKQLQSIVVQHAGDEEIELFPEVKTLFDREELEEMAARMQSLMEESAAAQPSAAAEAPAAETSEQPS